MSTSDPQNPRLLPRTGRGALQTLRWGGTHVIPWGLKTGCPFPAGPGEGTPEEERPRVRGRPLRWLRRRERGPGAKVHGALAGAEPLADSQGQGPWSPGHRALPAPLPRQGGPPKQRRPLCAVRRRATKPDELASQRSATALSHEGWARLRQCRPRSRKAGLGHPETPLGAPPCAGTLRGARGRAHGGDVAGTRLGRGVRVSEGPSAREDSAQPRRSGRAGRPAQRPAVVSRGGRVGALRKRSAQRLPGTPVDPAPTLVTRP